MYHTPSRKMMLAHRIFAWLVSLIAIAIGVTFVSALTLGYGFDKKDGHIERGGILQIDSKPSSAVSINGKPYSSTPVKLVSSPGAYDVKLSKPGYRDWEKTVPIQAGNITWVKYAKLFPEDSSSEKVANLDNLIDALPSGNGEYYAFLTNVKKPTVLVADTDDDNIKLNKIIIPNDIITKVKSKKSDKDNAKSKDKNSVSDSKYKLYLWSGDRKHIIVKHTYGSDSSTEWLLIDIEHPKKSININNFYGTKPKELVFSNYNGSDLAVLEGGNIRLINLDNNTLSRPLVRDVDHFRIYDEDYILYVTRPTKANPDEQVVGYFKSGFNKPVKLVTVPYVDKNVALVDFGEYFHKHYLFVSYNDEATLYVMREFSGSEDDNIKLNKVTTIVMPKAIKHLDISSNSQLATVQDGYNLATYNLEVNKQTVFKLAKDSDKPQKLRNLSEYLFWGNFDGKLHTYGFDGSNQYTLMDMDPEYEATFSKSGKYLYTISHNKKDKYFLQRLKMYS